MSGALFFFFWPPNWPGTGSVSVAEVVAPPAHGSGFWPYEPLDDIYWSLWTARFNRADAQPHATFDLQAQLEDMRRRLGIRSASAVAASTLSASLESLSAPLDPF